MNITVRTIYGKTLTCYVNDRPVFSMPISRRQQFNARVESLKAADHNMKIQYAKKWLASQRLQRVAVVEKLTQCDELRVAFKLVEPAVVIEHVPSTVQNQAAASKAKILGIKEQDRRLDDKLIPWIEAGMPVPISPAPLFGGLANE